MPVLNKLRARYPAARLDWLTVPAIAELLRPNPKISNVVAFARDDWRQPWRLEPYASAARLAAQLRAARYDLVLDLQGQFRSGVIARVTGAPVRIGFGRPRPQAWEASARKLPEEARKHAWQGAREGAWLAYTACHPVADARYACGRPLSRCRADAGARRRPGRLCVSAAAGRRRADRCLAAPARHQPAATSSSWRRARTGRPSAGTARNSPRSRAIFSHRG